MNDTIKILTIQDISCYGQCSITVALPIVSAFGIETAILPSAVLSTHTAGFTDFTVRDLTEDDISKIRACIDKNYQVEGDLRSKIAFDIKRLIEIGCYRCIRHRKGLPVRGQRSKTNARTRKGAKKTVANKKA